MGIFKPNPYKKKYLRLALQKRTPKKWEYSSLIPTKKVPKTSTSKKNPQKMGIFKPNPYKKKYLRLALQKRTPQKWEYSSLIPSKLRKLYVFPIESAFKYSHQLNRNESSNGLYILRSHFKFIKLRSVTFLENRKSMM